MYTHRWSLLHVLHYHLVPLYMPPTSNHLTVVHVHESFFPFCSILPPLTSPLLPTPTSCYLFFVCRFNTYYFSGTKIGMVENQNIKHYSNMTSSLMKPIAIFVFVMTLTLLSP